MTSTNVFTGMAGGRNSSRVLRPPGGGHTDVLGLSGPPVQPQEKKMNPRNISSITEGTNTMTQITQPKQECEKPKVEIAASTPSPTQEVPVTQETASKPVPVIQESALPKATKEAPPVVKEAPPAQANTRGRVPPGGFSSGGFW